MNVPGAVILGLDLGSAHCGVVATIDGIPMMSARIDVGREPASVARAAAEIERAIVESCASVVVVEWSTYWGGSKTAQEESAKVQAREIMTRIDERIAIVCEQRKIERVTITPQSWRSRLGIRKPTPPGGSRVKGDGWRDTAGERWIAPSSWHDTAVKVALVALLGPLAAMLRSVDERDAFGAALGYYRRPEDKPEKPPRVKRAPGEPKPRKAPPGPRKRGPEAEARKARKLAAGCTCKRKCARTCPMFVERDWTKKIAPALGRSWLH